MVLVEAGNVTPLVLSWYVLIYLYFYSASICISGRAFPAIGLITALAII
jgi:hypothetical protein